MPPIALSVGGSGIARTLVILLCLAAVAGCRRPESAPGDAEPSVTPRAITFATAVSSVTPVAPVHGASLDSTPTEPPPRPIPTATWWPSPTTWPVFPTPTPGPAQLQMTLADAEATALAGTIAEQAPRIERSGYIGAAEALSALGSSGDSDVYLYGRDASLHFHLANGGARNFVGEPGGPIAMVELSQLGMDILGVGGSGGDPQASSPEACRPVPAAQRYAVTLFIDPRSAREIGHALAPLPEALWAVASPAVDHVRVTATPRPSYAPTETPEPDAAPTSTWIPSRTPGPLVDPEWPSVPLGVGEYPAALHDAIVVWPLVVGSSWTYRAKGHSDGLTWSAFTVTETVVAASRRGQELMEVVIVAEGQGNVQWPRTAWSTLSSVRTSLIVRRDGVLHQWVGADGPVSQAQALATLPPYGSRAERDASLMAMVRFPLAVNDAEAAQYAWWSVVGAEPVASTTGTFPSCYQVTEIVSAGSLFGHWLCPGVGFARHEQNICSSAYGGYYVFDLIDHTIPPLVAVE